MASGNQDESQDMAKVMGFANFGGEKKAKQFDLMAMFEQTRRTAVERSQKTLASREEEEVSRQKKKLEEGNKSDSSNSDSDMIGPPIPGQMKKTLQSKHSKAEDSHSKHLQQSTTTQSHTKDSDDDDDDMIGPPIPPSMLKSSTSSKTADDSDSEDEDMIGPPLPAELTRKMKAAHAAEQSDEDDEEEEDEEDDDNNPLKKIPFSHEIVLDHGSRVVSALGLDPSGARIATGGFDFDVKFWDFAGMDANLRSFRNMKPCQNHQIKALEYSVTGDKVLVVGGNSQAKVLDRDGFEVFECVKGYQYILDKAMTKGHTAMLNDGCWHPYIREEFMTCSNDCTVRLWDINDKGKKHYACIKPKSGVGKVTVPTACTYSRDGKYIAVASQDGSIQIWTHGKNYVNTTMIQRKGHTVGTDTSCLCFSYDSKLLASRGGCGDDTVKLWDLRMFKQPLCVATDLENLYPMTDVLFSPDDRLVLTGVSVKKGEGVGKLVFLDRDTLHKAYEMEVSEGSSVVRTSWHPKLNQIVVGCADGSVKVYYDPEKSKRGAMLSVVKTKRKIKQVEMMMVQNIITPYALPMFRGEGRPTSTKKQEEKARKDPIKSKKPELPMTGPGFGGRLGNKGATLSQYVVQQLVKKNPDERDKDPRAAILRHAEEASTNPFWIDPAYKKTQPAPIFQPPEEDGKKKDDDEPEWKKARI